MFSLDKYNEMNAIYLYIVVEDSFVEWLYNIRACIVQMLQLVGLLK